MENNANCFALGSTIYGKAKKQEFVVGLIIGTGLGSGFVVKKKLFLELKENLVKLQEFIIVVKLLKNIVLEISLKCVAHLKK